MDLFSMVKEYLKPSTLNLDFMDTVFFYNNIYVQTLVERKPVNLSVACFIFLPIKRIQCKNI